MLILRDGIIKLETLFRAGKSSAVDYITEKGGPIAIADHFLINNGSLEHLHEQIDEALDDIKFYE